PGAEGMNRQAPNWQNTDEAKANPFPNLPDPLTLKNGEKVTTPEMWWKQRRPEIVENFDREVYGRVPANVPKVAWKITSTTKTNIGNVPVITKQLVGHVDNSSYPAIDVNIQLTLTTPAEEAGPVPVMLEFGFGNFAGLGGRGRFGGTNNFNGTNRPGGTNAFRSFAGFNGPNWQQLVLSNGWGCAVIVPTSYQADNGAGLTKGIIGLCNKGQPRKPDDWGALRAWAWGASRALDYFETDPAVDAKQVGIEGLSRYGKATLVTMAYDQRFAIALVGSSGEGGAKLSRRNWGELVENLTGTGGYHWMAGNFLKYGGPLTAGDMPVDAHELIALCAPRPTFISYGASSGPGAEGTWVDQHGSFMAAVAAGPVFRLLGKKDLGTPGNYLTDPMPPVNTALLDGELAWRQHDGGHTDGPNWPVFLKWANKYIHVANPPSAPPK
ncbi:MAG TPA: acetylxylan esterase, partial [Verrucomicrobiae bacterium]